MGFARAQNSLSADALALKNVFSIECVLYGLQNVFAIGSSPAIECVLYRTGSLWTIERLLYRLSTGYRMCSLDCVLYGR